jgi:hypothetical protein
MNSLPQGRATLRGRSAIVLLLIAAILLGPHARAAKAQEVVFGDSFQVNGRQVDCSGPARIVQRCELGSAGMYLLEQQAISELLTAHQLPATHADRLMVWERNQVRALVFDKLLALIKKAPNQRSAVEAEIYEKLAGRVAAKRLQAAQFAKAEYIRCTEAPCQFVPIDGFTYNTAQTACLSLLGGLFGGVIPPSLEEFINYGLVKAYAEV